MQSEREELLEKVLRELLDAEASYRSAISIYADHPHHMTRIRAESGWHHAKNVAKCVLQINQEARERRGQEEMDAKELNDRLVAVGAKIKAKGWKGASIDIGISYLAMFGRKPGPLDPVILYSPCIRATVHHSDRNGDFEHETQQYSDGLMWDIKDLDAAMTALEGLAEKMPRMADESARVKAAKAKLSDDEKRILGIR